MEKIPYFGHIGGGDHNLLKMDFEIEIKNDCNLDRNLIY